MISQLTCPWQSHSQPTRTNEEEGEWEWVLVATSPVVVHQGAEGVAEVGTAKVMIMVVVMTHMVVVVAMMTVTTVTMAMEVMAAVTTVAVVVTVVGVATVVGVTGMVVEGMEVVAMALQAVVAVVEEEVVPGVRLVVVEGLQEEVHVEGGVVLVLEVEAHVVVLQGEEEAVARRNVSLVVMAIKEVAVATQKPRGSTRITARITGNRNSSGARTTATETREISSGTKIRPGGSSGSDYSDWQLFNLTYQIYC